MLKKDSRYLSSQVIAVVVSVLLLAAAGYTLIYTSKLRVVVSPESFSYTSLDGNVAFVWSLPVQIQTHPSAWYQLGIETDQYSWANFVFADDNQNYGLHLPLYFIDGTDVMSNKILKQWAANHKP